MHTEDVQEPCLSWGNGFSGLTRPHQIRPGEEAQLYSNTLGSEHAAVLPRDPSPLTCGFPGLTQSHFLQVPHKQFVDLTQKVLLVCR